MNPIVHAELSWLASQTLRDSRDRRLVLLAGIAPDLDGFAIVAGLDAYDRWHRVATHGIAAAVVVATMCGALARRKVGCALLAFAAFHLHLVCDFVGSGPGWTIYYFWPWSRADWGWAAAWELNSWQNEVIGLLATLACLGTALPFGRTMVEVFSSRLDRVVVETVRRRMGASLSSSQR